MNYTAILKRALQIAWRQRALWLFGFLLALFGGGGNVGRGPQRFQYTLNGPDIHWPEISWALVAAIALALLVIATLLSIVGIIVRFTSIGALIGMVDEVERTESTSIRSGFSSGWARFLRLFAISLLLGVPVVIVLLLLLAVALSPLLLVVIGADSGAAVLIALGILITIGLFLPWLLVALVVGAVVEALSEFMYRRCVLAQEGVIQSIREGYRMVRRNLRDAGLTWLLLFGIGLALGVLFVPIVLLGLAMVVGPALLAATLARSVVVLILVALPLLLVFVAVIAFLQGLYLVFRSTVWTLVYREIVGRERAAAPVEA